MLVIDQCLRRRSRALGSRWISSQIIDLIPLGIAGTTTIALKGNRYEHWYGKVV